MLEDANGIQRLVIGNMPEHIKCELLSTIDLRSSPLLANNFEEFAVGFYFSIYAGQPVKNPLEKRGYMDFVVPAYFQSKLDSTLRMSVMAVASSLFTAWLGRNPDSPLTRSFYLRALSTMKEQLTRSDTCSNDEMLMSVLLLQLYETLISTAKGQRASSPKAHLKGALALIKHRGVVGFENEMSQGLLFNVRGQIIEDYFRASLPMSEDVYVWKDIMSNSPLPHSVLLETIALDIVNLNASIAQLLLREGLKTSSQNSEVISLLTKAADIENRMADWNASIPSSSRPVKVDQPECFQTTTNQASPYQQHCEIYPSITNASMWNRYRIWEIRIQSLMLTLLPQLAQTEEITIQLETCNNKVQLEVDDICASIPYHIGDRIKPGAIGDRRVQYPRLPGQQVPDAHYLTAPALGGFTLLLPLGTVIGMKTKLRDGQKEWMGGQLIRLYRIYNIGRK
ncbi:hypothetical protein BGZ60DRAFT_5625 [Tricladium varicosporioides]|nr:hypothetical protein BGZ60DRAFT_5625 [Hymenoscyphus varicosporioides]